MRHVFFWPVHGNGRAPLLARDKSPAEYVDNDRTAKRSMHLARTGPKSGFSWVESSWSPEELAFVRHLQKPLIFPQHLGIHCALSRTRDLTLTQSGRQLMDAQGCSELDIT